MRKRKALCTVFGISRHLIYAYYNYYISIIMTILIYFVVII